MAKPSITNASRQAQDAAEAEAIRTLVILERKGCSFRSLYASAKLVRNKADRRAVCVTLFEIAFRLSEAETIGVMSVGGPIDIILSAMKIAPDFFNTLFDGGSKRIYYGPPGRRGGAR